MTQTTLRSHPQQEMNMKMKKIGHAAFARRSGQPRPSKPFSPAVFGGLLLGATLGLSACGGSPSQSLDIRIEGLRAAGLVISLTPEAEDEVKIPANGTVHTFSGLAPSQPYAITVRRHPLNQLCRVDNGTGRSAGSAGAAVAVVCHRTLLNDTGSELAHDGAVGRDAFASALTKTGSGDKGFDFTQLCVKDVSSGAVEPCKTVKRAPEDVKSELVGGWVCTRDNVTGLVWRVADPDGTGALCGIPDLVWSTPTASELAGVLDYGKSGPAWSSIYFPQMGSKRYLLDVSGDGVYFLTPDHGLISEADASDVLDRIRVARPQQPPAAFDSHANGDGLWVDHGLELMWHLPASSVAVDFAAVQSTAAALSVGGYSDWRLPNYKELVALFEVYPTCVSEGCGQLRPYLVATGEERFWSSTVYAGDQSEPVSDRSRLVLHPHGSDGGFTTGHFASNLVARAIFVRNLEGAEVPP